jgi:hypothetical protein
VAIPALFLPPLHWVVAGNARLAPLAAIRDVVSIEVGQRAVAALAIVDDAVQVAVGGPFED